MLVVQRLLPGLPLPLAFLLAIVHLPFYHQGRQVWLWPSPALNSSIASPAGGTFRPLPLWPPATSLDLSVSAPTKDPAVWKLQEFAYFCTAVPYLKCISPTQLASTSSFHAHLNGHHFYEAFSDTLPVPHPLPPPLSPSKTSLLCLKGLLTGGPSCLLSLCEGHGLAW